MKTSPVLVALALLLLSSCAKEEPANAEPDSYPLAAGIADEASGIADSRANPGNLWVQQDGGNAPELILISHTAQPVKKIFLKGVSNRDWEDMVLAGGPDPARNYIYIGEIGDNASVYNEYAILRFPEPAAATDTVSQVESIRFRYPDGPHDAEAFLIEPGTSDIYIITKRDAKSLLYRIASPYSTTVVNTAVAAGQLPYNLVVSAALQPDGRGIVVKDYLNLYYYPRQSGESIAKALTAGFTNLPYTPEQQGEAVCFSNDNLYYFTLSEKVNSNVSLVRYRK